MKCLLVNFLLLACALCVSSSIYANPKNDACFEYSNYIQVLRPLLMNIPGPVSNQARKLVFDPIVEQFQKNLEQRAQEIVAPLPESIIGASKIQEGSAKKVMSTLEALAVLWNSQRGLRNKLPVRLRDSESLSIFLGHFQKSLGLTPNSNTNYFRFDPVAYLQNYNQRLRPLLMKIPGSVSVNARKLLFDPIVEQFPKNLEQQAQEIIVSLPKSIISLSRTQVAKAKRIISALEALAVLWNSQKDLQSKLPVQLQEPESLSLFLRHFNRLD